jgi:hypothetical protein
MVEIVPWGGGFRRGGTFSMAAKNLWRAFVSLYLLANARQMPWCKQVR